jgi:hypothetical protein
MEEEMQIIEYKQVDLSNAVSIEAFPTETQMYGSGHLFG